MQQKESSRPPCRQEGCKKEEQRVRTFIVLLIIALIITAAAGASSRTAGVLSGYCRPTGCRRYRLGGSTLKLGALALLGGAAGFLISLLMRLFNAGEVDTEEEDGAVRLSSTAAAVDHHQVVTASPAVAVTLMVAGLPMIGN